MPFLRKRARDPQRNRIVAAFRACAGRVDAAQRALLAAIPTPRDEGRSLVGAIDEFLQHLEGAETAMPAWRHPAIEHEWTKCRDAIADARAEATVLRTAGPLGFEALNARVGEVIFPLEAFAEAAGTIRRFGRHG